VDLRDELPYPILAPQSLLRLHFPDPWPVLRVCTDRSPHGSRPSVMALLGFSLRGWRFGRRTLPAKASRTVVRTRSLGQVFHRPTLPIHTPVVAASLWGGRPCIAGSTARATSLAKLRSLARWVPVSRSLPSCGSQRLGAPNRLAARPLQGFLPRLGSHEGLKILRGCFPRVALQGVPLRRAGRGFSPATLLLRASCSLVRRLGSPAPWSLERRRNWLAVPGCRPSWVSRPEGR